MRRAAAFTFENSKAENSGRLTMLCADIAAPDYRINETAEPLRASGQDAHLIAAQPHKSAVKRSIEADGVEGLLRVTVEFHRGGGLGSCLALFLAWAACEQSGLKVGMSGLTFDFV